MTFTPYTKDAVTRIRNGATARELGWDDLFYSRVCTQHGVPPNLYRPQTHTVAEIAPSVPVAPAAPAIKPTPAPTPPESTSPPATGPCTFHPATRDLNRMGHHVQLPKRQAAVFAFILKGTPSTPANGNALSEIMKSEGVGGHIVKLRKKLVPLNLKIAASRHPSSGYWVADLSNGGYVKTILVGPGAKS